MIQSFAAFASPVLNFSPIRRVRRNHGLEHATIHILSKRISTLRMAGRADNDGFILYGEAETEHIQEAVDEALRRMRSGEHSLAVHPNCGTGLVTTSLMTSLAAIIGFSGARGSVKEMFNRLPLAMLLSIGALIVSQPVGLSLQRYITTYGDPGDLEFVGITRQEVKMPFGGDSPMTVHRIRTRNG